MRDTPKAALVLFVILSSAGTVRAEPPFRAEESLFDSRQPRTLGLEQVDATVATLYRAASDTHKFCHHPNLVAFRERLFCMWSNGLVGEDEPGQRVLISHSSDGTNWTAPKVLAEDPARVGACVAAGFLVADEELVALFTITGGENFHPKTSLWAKTSSDGEQWSNAVRIAPGFFIEGPTQLPNGRLMMAGEAVGEARTTKRTRLLITDDATGLREWKRLDIPIPSLKEYGYTEPSFFRQRNGRLVGTIRNYTGRLHAIVSRDGGRSWSTPTATNFPDSTARTSAGNLPSGAAYVINNASSKRSDRSILTIAVSRDGVLFDRAWVLRNDPTKKRFAGRYKTDGWQYPHALVWKDWLFVAYSVNKEDVQISRISLTFFD